MTVARVVGNVWATRKHGSLKDGKLLLVQPLDGISGQVGGETSLAFDRKFGAGPGDTVLLVDEGGSARATLNDNLAPVRLIVCGIVDSVTADRKSSKYH